MTTTVITGIGELVTNDVERAEEGGLLGIVRDAAVLIEGTRVAWVGPAAEAPDADAEQVLLPGTLVRRGSARL